MRRSPIVTAGSPLPVEVASWSRCGRATAPAQLAPGTVLDGVDKLRTSAWWSAPARRSRRCQQAAAALDEHERGRPRDRDAWLPWSQSLAPSSSSPGRSGRADASGRRRRRLAGDRERPAVSAVVDSIDADAAEGMQGKLVAQQKERRPQLRDDTRGRDEWTSTWSGSGVHRGWGGTDVEAADQGVERPREVARVERRQASARRGRGAGRVEASRSAAVNAGVHTRADRDARIGGVVRGDAHGMPITLTYW